MAENRSVFESFKGESDKERFISAMFRKPVDRVPNFEVLIEDMHVEKILGKFAGNTLAIGGDPAKGAGQEGRPMYPDYFMDLCEIIGQDIMCFEAGFWTPFKKYDENRKLFQVIDRSIKTRKDFEELILDGQPQIDNAVGYGKVDDIVEDLIEMGVNTLNPLDPYGIDYRDYKKRYGSRISFAGNVDIEFPLSKGTLQDIDNDVKNHMDVLKPGGGYIATCSHSIVNYIPHENFIAYINAIHKYGMY